MKQRIKKKKEVNQIKNFKFSKEKILAYSLLVFVVSFNLFIMFPLMKGSEVAGGDNSYHYAHMIHLKNLLENKEISGFWCPYWNGGKPMFYYYQHLGPIVIVSIYFLLLKTVSLLSLFKLSIIFLFSLFPLSIFISMRRLGFDNLTSSCSALFSTTISSSLKEGIEYASFLNIGLYSRLWGLFIAPLAISFIYTSLTKKRNYFYSVILLSLSFLGNLFLGYISAISSGFIILTQKKEIKKKIFRLAIIGILTFAVLSYWFIPMFLNSDYFGGKSPWKSAEGVNSYGYKKVLKTFFTGNLLDKNRIPILTGLSLIGLCIALFKRKENSKFIAFTFIFWFIAFFGRTTFGNFMNIMPMSNSFPLLMLIIPVHFFTIYLIGIGLGFILKNIKKIWILILILSLLIVPVFEERYHKMSSLTKTFEDFKKYPSTYEHFKDAVHFLRNSEPGRIVANKKTGWGIHYIRGLIPAYTGKYMSNSYAMRISLSYYYFEMFNPQNIFQRDLFNFKYYLISPDKKPYRFLERVFNIYPYYIYKHNSSSGYFDLVNSNIILYGDKIGVREPIKNWMNSALLKNKDFLTISFSKKVNWSQKNIIEVDRYGKVKKTKLTHNGIYDYRIKNINDYFKNYTRKNHNFGRIINESEYFNKYSALIEVNQPCYVLLKVSYHPNWHAFINGKEKETIMLSPSYIGVKVEPGIQEIIFKYKRSWFETSLIIFSILIVFIIWKYRKKFEKI